MENHVKLLHKDISNAPETNVRWRVCKRVPSYIVPPFCPVWTVFVEGKILFVEVWKCSWLRSKFFRKCESVEKQTHEYYYHVAKKSPHVIRSTSADSIIASPKPISRTKVFMGEPIRCR
jgi:hypothetical protein